MKRIWLIVVIWVLLLSGCAPKASSDDSNSLLLSNGTDEKSYSLADLQAMPSTEAAFNDVNYQGVSLPALLQDAGYDPQAIKAVKLVASDGYSLNYEPAIFTRDDVIVAYARVDGPLVEEDGAFRIVLPGAEGKLNMRMLVRLEVLE